MTAVSTEDFNAASTEIGTTVGKPYDVYIRTLEELVTMTENAWKTKVSAKHPDTFANLSIWDTHGVSVGGARQTGKSRAIAHLANPDDLVVCYNQEFCDQMLQLLPYRGEESVIPTILSAPRMAKWIERRLKNKQGPMPFQCPPRIYVDDARWAFDSWLDMRSFSRWLLEEYPHYRPTVICVG